MAHSWNNKNPQQGQQLPGQIQMFNPAQFQASGSSITNPPTMKYNQSTAGTVNAHQPPQEQQQHQPHEGNAWGGMANNNASGTMPDAQNSWTNWGSWDFSQEQLSQQDLQQQHQQYPQQHIPQMQQPLPPFSSADNSHGQNSQYQDQHHPQNVMPPATSAGAEAAPHYNNAWNTSGQYAQPYHNYESGQEMHYSQPHNMSYYGEHTAYDPYRGVPDQQQQHTFPDATANPLGHQSNADPLDLASSQQSSSAGLDQGQSQVLYDQPSVPQHEFNNPSNYTESGPWLHNEQQQQVGVVDRAEGTISNENFDTVGQSSASSLVAPNLSPSNSFPIPVIATTSQCTEPLSEEPTLNDYCDNDSDGGTVAGFFGRGDDDGDVSSDAQRSNKSSTNFNTSGSDTSGHGQYLNPGKAFGRENSEISNASMSTLNMSLEDDGKEHLNNLQALVQRMEDVNLASMQGTEKAAQGVGHGHENASSQVDHMQQLQEPCHGGDYSGFGNDALQQHNMPPPTLNLDTNPERPSSPDGGIPASSEGSGGSGGSSGLTDWEIVPSQSQMTHSRNSSLDNNINMFTDKPDGSINEPQRESKDGGMDGTFHTNQNSSLSFNPINNEINFQSVQKPSHCPSQNPSTAENKTDWTPGAMSAHNEQLPQIMENLSLGSNSVTAPPPSSTAALSLTPPSSHTNPQQEVTPEIAAAFQTNRSPHLNSSAYKSTSASMKPPPMSNLTQHLSTTAHLPSNPDSNPQTSKSIPLLPSRPKMTSEDGVRPANKKESDQRSTSSNSYEQKFKKPQDLSKKESGDKNSLASDRRHHSAFQPVHRIRKNTVSPATTLWDTDSGSSSNILLAPAMPLIIPALNPYSSSASATATTDTASIANVSKTSSSTSISERGRGMSKEQEDQTPRSRYGDRRDREKGRDERERTRDKEREKEDSNRSFDSLDEIDSVPEYRSSRDQEKYKVDRPDSRSDRRPESRSDRRPESRSDRYQQSNWPSHRGERPSSRNEGYRDDQYRQHRGYYGDSYYDEHYDRPRSRHDEARNSRPSSRSGGQEIDRPKSRGGDYDRDREYGYRDKDRNRGYYYDGYNRNADYYDERDRYYRYYRDRDARYSRGYYEEYYGSKNAEYYLQQQKLKDQQQQPQKRPSSRSQESDGPGSRSHSRGNTPGPEQSDYYNRGSRPHSRNDYARDYYSRGYTGYDYSSYYDGYGYDPYYGYSGYADSVSQGYQQGRMTPPKHAYPHVKASFGANGHLVKVLPNRPSDGQPAGVEMLEVQTVLESCQEAEDLKLFPGPLTRDGTHKKDVLLFCQQKALECMEDVDMVDRESAQLIWKLLELLIKQNGSVVGTDLSDLLLEGHEPGVVQYSVTGRRVSQGADGMEIMTEDSLEGNGSSRNSPAVFRTSMDRTLITPSRQREDYIARFRHLLLFGRKKDAIECAMKHDLWGHALFLASKMDTRTHASVMIRFANSAMRMNDPLQTLYQLMSGRQPASVTCVSDERWGDWRPHLAMILSNQTSRPDLDRKSITTLGDTLAAKGCLHASHFCYLMAQIPFGTYDKKTSKIVLVGANHHLPLKEFASVVTIQCTEVYEYAQTLNNAAFCLSHFQLYKYLYACRLVDFGLVAEALMYCEVISTVVCRYPAYFQPSFVHLVFELASKLKYCDPQRQNNHVDENEDPVWIQQLLSLLSQYADGTIQPVSETLTPANFVDAATIPSNVEGHGQYQPGGMVDASGYAATGDAPPQNSGPAGFDVQGYNQHSQQPEQTMQQGQYYQDPAVIEQQQQQQQQQHPGYDETDASQYQQAQHQYHDGTNSAISQGYDQQQLQQQQDYSQWQQQQYAAYQYMGYGVETQQQPHEEHQQQHQTVAQTSLSSSSSSSSTSAAPLPSTLASRPNYDVNSVPEDTDDNGQQIDLASSQASSGFSGLGYSGSSIGDMAMPPRASISTNETEDDDEEDDDDINEEGGAMTGFDYFGNAGSQRVVPPPHRHRTTSESSNASRRRRTISEGSTGSVKASPHKPAPPTTSKPHNTLGSSGSGGDMSQGGSSGGGWFGGLFSKFGRKGKNEMILPDDKDPAIVWDFEKEKWMNADGTEEEVIQAAPPPKDIDLISGKNSGAGPTPAIPSVSGMPPPPSSTDAPGTNKFSLKAKGVRNQYVDVNNPKPISAPQGLFSMPPTMSNGTPSGTMPQVFLPGSTNTTSKSAGSNDKNDGKKNNLLSIANPSISNDLSRSSSMNSVNQEVQRLTGQIATDSSSSSSTQQLPVQAPATEQTTPAIPTMPVLFNPASFNTGGTASHSSAAGPGLKYGQRRAYPKK